MEIKSVQNNVSFKMGWAKGAKAALAKRVSQFSEKQRPTVIALINDINKKSVNHNIGIDIYDYINAHPHDWNYSKYESFHIKDSFLWSLFGIRRLDKKNFRKTLTNLRDFIIKDNEAAVKIIASAKEYLGQIKPYVYKRKEDYIFRKGLCFDKEGAQRFSYKLAQESQTPDGLKKVDSFIKKMIELDKRAKNMNILIDGSPYYNEGFYIEGGQYSHLHVIKKEIKDGEPLSKIVKKLEKIISDEENFDKKIQEVRRSCCKTRQ